MPAAVLHHARNGAETWAGQAATQAAAQAAAQAATEAASERAAGIAALCAKHGANGRISEFIAGSMSLEQIRAELHEVVPPVPAGAFGSTAPPMAHEGRAATIAAIARPAKTPAEREFIEAIDARHGIGQTPGGSELLARAMGVLAHAGILDDVNATPSEFISPLAAHARDMITRASYHARNLPDSKVMALALDARFRAEVGGHTTSDFTNLLELTAQGAVMRAFIAYQSGLLKVSAEKSFKDFRPYVGKHVSGGEELSAINESGEFQSGTVAEGSERFSLTTFGKVYTFTRQLLTNDADRALMDVANLGRGAAQAVGKAMVNQLEANAGLGATMSDGDPAFDASARGNVATSPAAIDVAGLADLRLLMRRQRDENGNPLSPAPNYLIVPPDLETAAEMLLADLAPAKVADTNPFAHRLELIVEPLLNDPARWWLAAGPAVDGLAHGYLGGAGVDVRTEEGFRVDGVSVRLRLDFGCGWLEPRTWATATTA